MIFTGVMLDGLVSIAVLVNQELIVRMVLAKTTRLNANALVTTMVPPVTNLYAKKDVIHNM